MSAATTFYAKFGLKDSVISASKEADYTFIHDLIVRPFPYKGRNSLMNMEKDQEGQHFQYTNPKTSFYLCKQYNPSLEIQQMPRNLMKRIAYRKNNQVDKWGRPIYNNSETKNIDQVATEFQCLTLLKGSHRAIQMKSFLHENVQLKSDKKFFYHNLKLADKRSKGIRNVCFILEQMNQGSLRQQLEMVNQNKQPFSQEKIVQYSCQFAQGLKELKKKGIIHRDLRPDNVLIHNGQLKFADFDSAFIKGYSDYRNIKNGVEMKQTTPLQIMLLIAQSQEKLKQIDSDQLYERQQKADIYYLGVNIYSMVFSQMYQSFNGGQVLRNLIHIKKRSGFCSKLLDLMSACLEKDPHVRISMDQVIKTLSQIEQEFYLNSSSYRKIYLGVEPLNLHSFSSNQIQAKIDQVDGSVQSQQTNDRKQMDENFEKSIRTATLQRNTSITQKLFKRLLQDVQGSNIWGQNSKSKLLKINQNQLVNRIQNFLQRLQIKAYYYQVAYRILFQVNLAEVKSQLHFQNLRNHLDLFSNQLVVVLTFIYNTILKCSFTSDPLFEDSNPTYQLRRVFENIKTLHSRWQFFSGRLKLQNQANKHKKQLNKKLQEQKNKSHPHSMQQLQQIQQSLKVALNGIQIVQSLQNTLENLTSKQYQSQSQRLSFFAEERLINKCLDRTESIVKKQMIQTIVSLILAYEKIKTQPWGFKCNLKNAIFMLMILEAQNTKTVQKNDMVIIKTELTTMINMNLGWKSEELEAFFNNYTNIHTEQVMQGLIELQSQAIILSEKTNQIQPQAQDFCIQINAPEKGQALLPKQTQPSYQQTPKFKSNEQQKKGFEKEIRQSIELAAQKNKKVEFEEPNDKVIEVEVLEESNIRQTFDFGIVVTNLQGQTALEKKQSVHKNKYLTMEEYD